MKNLTENEKKAYDRGKADYYYRRPCHPNFYVSTSNIGEKVESENMSSGEIRAYYLGYEWGIENGERKDYGD